MISDGLERAGQIPMANRIKSDCLRLIDEGGFAEYYDPNTAEGCGGDAFTWTLPGVDAITGEAMPSIRGFSPREMIALFDDPIVDDWPEVAARFRTISPGKIKVTVLDDGNLHHFTADGHDLGDLKYVDSEGHGVDVCPVTVWENISDVDGRGYGEIEPIISVLRRLDQTKNDRLVVQQYASYVVKTISGIDIPEGEAKKAHIKLSAKKMLTSDSTEAKFGSLPASPLEPFNQSYEADLRDLSAVTQLPPHTFLGALVNLSAEALAAASAGEAAKRDERQHSYGESAERNLRLAAAIAGNTDAAADYESRVIWKDTTIRSLAQVADALGKLANGLGFPPQLLWNRIPNVTQQEIAEALDLIKEQDVVTRALAEMAAGQTSPEAPIPEAA